MATISTRPTLTARMAEGYMSAAIFALEAECQASKTADYRMAELRRSTDEDAHDGLTHALGVSVLRREFWRDEAARCESIVSALAEVMG